MALESATAIIVRTTDWSESSLVVTLFTREFGKVRAVAKGARRPKGPFESALDVLSQCRIVFIKKSSDALDVLAEAKLIARFRPFERGLAALHAGYYVAELLDKLTDDYDPHPELFDLAAATLAELRASSPNRALVLHFELATLRRLGYFPALEECVHCGAAIGPAARIPLSYEEGGVLCARCRPGKRNVVAISQAAWRAMRFLGEERTSASEHGAVPLAGLEQLPSGVLGELRPIVSHYVNHVVGHVPRAQGGIGG